MKNRMNETRQVGKRIGLLSTNTTRALLFVFALLLYTGNVSGNYYTDFKATVSPECKGMGYVYAADNNTSPTTYYETSDDIERSDNMGSTGGKNIYYAWAKADRGREFTNWTITSSNNNSGITPTTSTNNFVTVTVLSNVQGGTNTGIATATFTALTASEVTCHASKYGDYKITYSYEKANGDDTNGYTFSNQTVETNIEFGKTYDPIPLYSTDKVTLEVTSNKDGFLGWYSDADFENPLKDTYTATTYTYTVEDGATEAIYAKFAPSKTFYGKLTTQIASSSIGRGGKIYASTTETANPAYTDQSSTIDATPKTPNMEATSVTQTYHLYAQPTDVRYVFRGWFNNAECTESLSNDLHYTDSMVVASEDEENPTRDTLYACFDLVKPYYLQVEASTNELTGGMVCVSETNTTPDRDAYATHSMATITATSPSASAYLYAISAYGYKFDGWYNAEGTLLGTANPYTYNTTKASDDASNPTYAHVFAKFVVGDKVNITYNYPSNGSYIASALALTENNGQYEWTPDTIYNSEDYTGDVPIEQYTTDNLTLIATPEEGYGVRSWTDGSDTITTVLNTYQTTITSAKTLGVTFEESKPYFLKGTELYFSDLQEALNTARDNSNKVVVVVKDACVPAGTYTIPSGVTLYIPYSENSAPKGKDVEIVNDVDFVKANCKVYIKLTLAEGVTIDVSGKIEVGAQQVAKGQNSTGKQGNNGAIYQGYGKIIMSQGSYINLKAGAFLYAWGRITGSSESRITANSGSTVYESFQITDFQGGSRTTAMYNDREKYKIFPFSQYYIQNIEVPLRIRHGAKELVNAALVASSVAVAMKDLPIIGNNSAMFTTTAEDSYVEKMYDETKDRQIFKINGNATLTNFSFKYSDYSINTVDFLLPLTNNMDIYLERGTVDLNANVILTADANVVIRQGVTVNLKSNVFVYDSSDWKTGFVFQNKIIAPLKYTIPYSTVRTTVSDATIQVDGELIVTGNLYVSSGKANICSTGTGKVSFPNGNTCEESCLVHHLDKTKGASILTFVESTFETQFYPAQLHNDEEKNPTYLYTPTAGSAANVVFVYNKDMGKWLKNPVTVTWDANGGTCETKTTALESGKPLGVLPIAEKKWYKFKGWYTAASGGDTITSATTVMTNITYYAQYEFETIGNSLDIVDADGTNLTINANGWASSGWHYTLNNERCYPKEKRQADRTLKVPYSGKANDDLPLILRNKTGKVISKHIYKVPFVYTGTEDMSDMNENSIVFVKSGTLTIGTDSVKEIYVADSAELEVTGKLTVGKLVLRTTPYKAAVLTIETDGSIALADGGQVFYSRIAPNKSTIKDLHGDTTTYNSARYYQFGLPLSCPISSVTMSNAGKLGGSQPKYGTAWMLKSYSESSRAENGISNEGANWSLLPSEGTITAGVGYEMFSNSNYYREFYFPVDLTTATDTVSVQYTKGTKEEHNGWNIITSPLTSRANVPIIDPATAIKPCWLLADGSYTQEIPEIIPPAVPFAYQTSTADTLNFVVSTAAAAPRRQSAAEAATETEWVHLDIFNNEGRGDETSLFVHPTRFEQDYKPGIDVAKQSLTASRAILYTAHAYGNMAFAGVADTLLENGIDVIVYSPTEQQLTFSLRENAFLNRLEYLWLADNKTGARTDLLLNDYTFRAAAGTDKQRFVLNGRFKAPQISTGIGNTQTDYKIYAIGNNIAISGVEQGTPIYVFDAVGHMIYTTAATTAEVIVPAPCAGVYMLTIGGQTTKLVINQ